MPLGPPLAAATLAADGARVVALAPTRRRARTTVELAWLLRARVGDHLVVRPGQPNQLRHALGGDTGRVDLVLLLGLPRAQLRHPALLPTAVAMLRPGGHVVAVVQQRTRPDDDLLPEFVAGAAREGLRYDQHVIALLRSVTSIAAQQPRTDGRRDVGHADVLVFTRPTTGRARG